MYQRIWSYLVLQLIPTLLWLRSVNGNNSPEPEPPPDLDCDMTTRQISAHALWSSDDFGGSNDFRVEWHYCFTARWFQPSKLVAGNISRYSRQHLLVICLFPHFTVLFSSRTLMVDRAVYFSRPRFPVFFPRKQDKKEMFPNVWK